MGDGCIGGVSRSGVMAVREGVGRRRRFAASAKHCEKRQWSSHRDSGHRPAFRIVMVRSRAGTIACPEIKGKGCEPSVDDRGAQIGHQRYVERSEEHTSELQSLMRISYAVFCLKKKKEK